MNQKGFSLVILLIIGVVLLVVLALVLIERFERTINWDTRDKRIRLLYTSPNDNTIVQDPFEELDYAENTVFSDNRDAKTLYAIDGNNGDIKWNFSYNEPDGIDSLGNNRVLASEGTVFLARASTLYALDSNSGEVKWELVDEELVNDNELSQDQDLIYWKAHRKLLAIDKKTGQKRWEYDSKDCFNHESPLVIESTAYILAEEYSEGRCFTAKLYAFNKDTGEILWTKNTTARTPSSIFYQDTNIVFYDNYSKNIFSIDTKNHELGTVTTTIKDLGSPIEVLISESILYANDRGVIKAVDILTGKQIWQKIVSGGSLAGMPIIKEGKIYFMSYDYQGEFGKFDIKLYKVDALSGEEMYAINFGQHETIVGPILGENSIYVVRQNNILAVEQ